MKRAEKEVLETNRKKASLKNMYFNRYLLIRYLTAGYFFTNLYWLIFLAGTQTVLAFIPLVLMVTLILAIAEQVKLYSEHTNSTPRTKSYYWLQFAVNMVLLPVIFSPVFGQLFPFMKNDGNGRQFILIIVLVGSFFCLVVQRKIYLIQWNRDRHFDRIQQYEKTLHI